MFEAQLGEDGATGRLLFGSYTSSAPGGGGFMLFKVLASAPVSIAVLVKMRRTRITALASTRGVFMQISFMQKPIVLRFLRRGGRQLNLVYMKRNELSAVMFNEVDSEDTIILYIYIYILCNILERG
jgi:hypothetical protein